MSNLKSRLLKATIRLPGSRLWQELVEKLTRPLIAEEKKTGEIKRDKGQITFAGTPDELQKIFLDKRMTDFLPVILPTEEKVNRDVEKHQPSSRRNAGKNESWISSR